MNFDNFKKILPKIAKIPLPGTASQLKMAPAMREKELKDLEINDLVKRKVYDTIPVKVTYKLTDYGYTLVPLIIELTKWGRQHREYIMKK